MKLKTFFTNFHRVAFPLRASNSPFHTRVTFSPRASLYYSINNQLRLILRLRLAFIRKGSIIDRNGSHSSRQWDVSGWNLGVERTSSLFRLFFLLPLMCPRVCWMKWESSNANWKCLLCGDDGNNNNNQASSYGDDILNWQFNLLMISLSYHSVSRMLRSDASKRDREIGSLYQQFNSIKFSADDSWWWLRKNSPFKVSAWRCVVLVHVLVHESDNILIINFLFLLLIA